jgi:hypothetical protein
VVAGAPLTFLALIIANGSEECCARLRSEGAARDEPNLNPVPIGIYYTTDEWQEISEGTSFDAVDREQVLRLHRHWIWANNAKREFEAAISTEGWDDYEDFTARAPWAMYMWYGLLSAVIAGYTSRRIGFRGRLREDIRPLREPLRNARNAAFHVEQDFDYYDDRLIDIVRKDPTQINRVHQALGQLLLDEIRRRNIEP